MDELNIIAFLKKCKELSSVVIASRGEVEISKEQRGLLFRLSDLLTSSIDLKEAMRLADVTEFELQSLLHFDSYIRAKARAANEKSGPAQRIDLKALLHSISARIDRQIGDTFKETEEVLPFAFDRGPHRENVIRKFLVKKLPKKYGVGTGIVVNALGHQTRQMDIIIYDAENCPILYSAHNLRFFPAESVYATVEVKSKLTLAELDKSIENAKSLKRVERMPTIEARPVITPDKFDFRFRYKANPYFCVVVAYSLGEPWANKEDKLWRPDFLDKLKASPRNKNLDFVCILDKGMFLPIRKLVGQIGIGFFDEEAEWSMAEVGTDNFAAFYMMLYSVLNYIMLEPPELLNYFGPHFLQGSDEFELPTSTAEKPAQAQAKAATSQLPQKQGFEKEVSKDDRSFDNTPNEE